MPGLKSVESRYVQFSTQKRNPPSNKSLPVRKYNTGFILTFNFSYGLLSPVNGLLTWSRKDKQIYTHTFWKTISRNKAHTQFKNMIILTSYVINGTSQLYQFLVNIVRSSQAPDPITHGEIHAISYISFMNHKKVIKIFKSEKSSWAKVMCY